MNEKKDENQIKISTFQRDLLKDACAIIEQAQVAAYRSIDETLIKRNWLLGLRIQHEVLKGKRADYGEKVVKMLAKELVKQFGNGFGQTNLYHFIAFYNCFPDFFYAVSRKSENLPATALSFTSDLYEQIEPTHKLRLSWTHYRIILQESNAEARAWYENEAIMPTQMKMSLIILF